MLDTALQYFKKSEDMRIKLESFGTKMVYLPEEDVAKMTLAAKTLWDHLAKSNDACAKGIHILKKQLSYYGRLN